MNSHVFTPIKIGPVTIKNRIALPSMCVFFCDPDGHMNDTFYDYVEERVRGGAGLVIIPGSPHGKVSKGRPALSDDSYIPDWEKLAAVTHKYGASLFCQLHPAKFQAGRGMEVETPMDYSEKQLSTLIRSYAECARRCQKAGADGVEIHGGHAHEVAMFMSPFYNFRTDGYGGDARGRARLPYEIIQAIKELCGKDYPVIMRISGNEYVEGGRDIKDSAEICKILEGAGVDAIHVTAGMPASDGYISAPMDVEDAFNAEAAVYMKSQVSVPVIAVNRIVDIAEAEAVIAGGKADMVAMARAQLADPELVNKALGLCDDPVRRCLGCNQGCRDAAVYKKIVCMQNPFLGFSRERILAPVTKPKKILIAGPAGLEMAVDLVKRGYLPEICEKAPVPGGLIRLAARTPKKENLNSITEYRVDYLKKHGVDIRCNTLVDAGLIAAEKPDVVVVATGSVPVVPSIPGIRGQKVWLCDDVLEGSIPDGEHVAVLGGGLIGCEIADLLAAMGKRVELIDMITKLAQDLNPSRRRFMLERMSLLPINYHLGKKVTGIDLPEVRILNEDGVSDLIGDIDALVVCAGRRPVDDLMKLSETFPEIRFVNIGDSRKAGLALNAIHEAAVTACTL